MSRSRYQDETERPDVFRRGQLEDTWSELKRVRCSSADQIEALLAQPPLKKPPPHSEGKAHDWFRVQLDPGVARHIVETLLSAEAGQVSDEGGTTPQASRLADLVDHWSAYLIWIEERANRIRLREVTEGDLPIFFAQQLDPTASTMAAFTVKDPTDRSAFTAHWTRILKDDAVTKRAIVLGGQVAGHIASFDRFGKPEVTYWIGREFWGRGVASAALSEFLGIVEVRPLYARAAQDNVASLRVLEKSGFTISGEDQGFAPARGEQVREFILKLE